MSITPAFSPGPWITHGALDGNPRKWILEDLYEQCSFHIAEKIPSSVKLGTRPISFRMRSYSSGLSPWAATSSGVICGSFMCMRRSRKIDGGGKGFLGRVSRLSRALRARGLHFGSGSDLRAILLKPRDNPRGRPCQNGIPQPPGPACRDRG